MFKFVFLCYVLSFSTAVKLPSYFKICKMDSPDFNECNLNRAREAFPHVIKGEPKFNIPPMTPLEITELDFGETPTMKMKLKNVKVFGLENVSLNKLDTDQDKKHVVIEATIPFLTITGEYMINGTINQIIPIEGEGPCNITGVNGKVIYEYDYDFIEKNNEKYFSLGANKMDYNMDRCYFQLDNLFKGNKELGDNINLFLNDNWKDIMTDLKPAIELLLGTIINTLFNGMLTKLPVNAFN